MNGEEETAAAEFPEIRLFQVPKTAAETPEWDVPGGWVETTPETARDFSAVGYFFGRRLHREQGVPVGLVHSSWGGTAAEWWTRREVLEGNPALKDIVARWKKAGEDYEARLREYEALQRKRTEAGPDAGGAAGADAPDSIEPPVPPEPRTRPGALFNGMIAPLVPYRIRGVIWYQGESNVGRAKEYRELFPAMIRDWRAQWGQGAFPFLFVQLANFGERKADPGPSAWADLRESQLRALSVPNTAMAVIIDIGEGDDIHPKNKHDVGIRLSLAALGTVYDRDAVYSGPVYDSMEIEGHRIRLHFNHAESGLVARGGELRGFAVAGEDRKFVGADAEIDGETVVVTSDRVPNPVAVRYAWADDPEVSLYNEAGLPASPFRTDEWPG
jgi:sialate O-acetylesterase